MANHTVSIYDLLPSHSISVLQDVWIWTFDAKHSSLPRGRVCLAVANVLIGLSLVATYWHSPAALASLMSGANRYFG